MDRIIAAFTFRTQVYAEVERDTTFTTTAWLIVAVASFLSALGSGTYENFLNWFLSVIGGTVFAIIGFAVAAFIINFVGRAVFNADSNFDEIVRTVGLAYVWQVFGILGIFGVFIPVLACVTAPIQIIAVILWVIAAFIAVKEALDLEWLQTIVTVFIGFVAYFVIFAIGAFILGLIGLGGALLFGAF
jgi:hypothetical protein